MKKVLVTGAKGQLGRCIRDAVSEYSGLDIFFASKNELDIENAALVEEFFKTNSFDYCINAAGYTNVEKAESEQEKAFMANAEAVKTLALQCKEADIIFIHISTDYVFDGQKRTPYLEEDATNPINVYGASKLKGEQYIQEICERYFIIRTSWLYSQYGHNFLKSILKLSKEEKQLTITTEQTGTPTNANDLARLVLDIIVLGSKNYGIYHFSNEGEATWYGFAEAILKLSNQFDAVKLVKTDHYRTFAKRPVYSVLDCKHVLNQFNVSLFPWEESLRELIKRVETN